LLPSTRARLADEAARWRNSGLIDAGLAATLAERYDARGSAGTTLLKWLGFFGVFMLASTILGFVGALAASAGLVAPGVLLAIAACAVGFAGARMAVDPRARHPVMGSALLTVGLVGVYGALVLFALAAGGPFERIYGPLLYGVAALACGVAYRFRLRWPLLLALLFFFHAVGSSNAYGGHGAYFADIVDPRRMAVTALCVAAFGLYHERRLEEDQLGRHVGFGNLYIVFGLLYVNLSLWFLSLRGPEFMSLFRPELGWVLLFAGAAVAQIVAGAALKDSRFTGFGIVFLAINLYTRVFERYWDRVSAGTFLAVAGVAALALGFAFERMARAGRDT
jgi:uncharacterized membrane protein